MLNMEYLKAGVEQNGTPAYFIICFQIFSFRKSMIEWHQTTIHRWTSHIIQEVS